MIAPEYAVKSFCASWTLLENVECCSLGIKKWRTEEKTFRTFHFFVVFTVSFALTHTFSSCSDTRFAPMAFLATLPILS